MGRHLGKLQRNQALQEIGFKLLTSDCSIQEKGLYVTKIRILTIVVFHREDRVTFYKFSIYSLSDYNIIFQQDGLEQDAFYSHFSKM